MFRATARSVATKSGVLGDDLRSNEIAIARNVCHSGLFIFLVFEVSIARRSCRRFRCCENKDAASSMQSRSKHGSCKNEIHLEFFFFLTSWSAVIETREHSRAIVFRCKGTGSYGCICAVWRAEKKVWRGMCAVSSFFLCSCER